MNEKGFFVLIGGAEDKRRDMIVLKRTVDLNNAGNIVIIPTASSYPSSLARKYYYAFKDLGINDINIFDIRNRHEADKHEYLEKINYADLIFFTGGNQVKLVDTIKHTELFRKIVKQNLKGATIAGTSAGAAAASDPLIYDGDDNGLVKGSVKYSEGFGFIKNITIDTHFDTRRRLLRLTQYLLSGRSHRGIGLGEDTAIIINPFHQFEVIGKGVVTIVNTKKVTYSNYNQLKDYEHVSANGINVGFLQSGTVFNMRYWSVNVEESSKSIYFYAESEFSRLN